MARIASVPTLVAVALMSGGVATPMARADDGSALPPVLRVPGFPPVPLPPGMHLHGFNGDASDVPPDISRRFGSPDGSARRRDGEPSVDGFPSRGDLRPKRRERAESPKAKPLTPEEKQAQIRKALTPPPPLAAMRRKTLDDLYAKLAAAEDETEAQGIASVITAIWARSGSDTANLLMARAHQAAAAKDTGLALTMLDKVIALQPNWAEAWNERASVRYLAGDLNGAMSDVEHVLKLEPKHFQAMNGLAMILQRTGFDKRALQVYRRELAIYPHQPEIESIVRKLSTEVEGQGI